MNFGFDFEGTIDQAPAVYGALMSALVKDGHGVHIITGCFRPSAVSDREPLVEKCFNRGIHYSELHIIDGGVGMPEDIQKCGEEKLRIVREENIALFVDDRPEWCSLIAPVATVLQALR